MISRPSALLLFLLSIAIVDASPASAQVADAWLRYTPVDANAGVRSTRLEGMGSIEVAVEDDQSLIDPYHHGRNPAALLMSRDTSIVVIPTVYENFDDRYYGMSHSAVGRGMGFHGEFRQSPRWGMAADVDYGVLSASRHDLCPAPDDCRFIRDFDLPVAPQMGQITSDRTIAAGVQTPLAAVTYARTFFANVTLGARVGFRHETEDRRIREPYDLDVSSDATEFAGGVLYPLPVWGGSVSVSGWGAFMEHRVVGRSESALNDDEYDWDRPQISYGGALHVDRGGWLRGIIDGRHRSFNGEEVARINWAPQFFMNPNPSENDPENVFKRRWSAFLSGLRHNEGSTRWLIGLPGKPVHLGFSYAYFRQYEWIRPNQVVLPTVDPLDVKRRGYRFASGLSVGGADGQGIVAVEARIAREYRQDFTREIPDISLLTYTYHFGAEYPLRPRLPLRGGVQVIRHDPNSKDANAPFKGIGLTAGAGYYWTALEARIDLSYAHYHFRHSPGDPSEEVGFGDRMSLSIQRLF
jgi:hypothetical protein